MTFRNQLLVTVVVTAALVLPAALFAAESTDIPRTASGKPDLTGTYDIATLTPLSRPARFADKKTITAEENKQIAEYWANNLAKDAEASDPDREAPPVGGTEIYVPEFSGAAGGVGGYNAFYVDLGDSNFKIDGEYRTSIIVDPPDGRFPDMTPEARARMAEAAKFMHANTGKAWWMGLDVGPYDDPELRPSAERCIIGFGSTAGPPALPVMYNNLKSIVQTDDHVVILAEMNHDARVVRLNSEHKPDSYRSWLGDSIGWWEGDTLVVDTTNFNDEPGFSRATRDLHVIERFTRQADGSLLYQFTVEDPSTWVAPFTGEYPWPVSENKMYEYACHEGNYALGNIMRGARLLEQDEITAGSTGGSGD